MFSCSLSLEPRLTFETVLLSVHSQPSVSSLFSIVLCRRLSLVNANMVSLPLSSCSEHLLIHLDSLLALPFTATARNISGLRVVVVFRFAGAEVCSLFYGALSF